MQAAANAHDLGHPPFGHLGERVLDRLARERFGLTDGFEGNAQTFRILTELEVHGTGRRGPQPHRRRPRGRAQVPVGAQRTGPSRTRTGWPVPPRGAGHGRGGTGAAKFSTYLDRPARDARRARGVPGDLPPGRQTLECSVMDLADDIAYSLHDVEDFHRSGVLQFSPVSSEFRSWETDRDDVRRADRPRLAEMDRTPGAGLERLRRRLRSRDAWMFDEATFAAAVATVGDEFVDGVLAVPYDGSMLSDRAISGFTSRWIDHLVTSVTPAPDPDGALRLRADDRAGLARGAGAEVRQHLLHPRAPRPRHAAARPGADDRAAGDRLRRLALRPDGRRSGRRAGSSTWCNAAAYGYERLVRDHPDQLDDRTTDADLARMARGRGIADFVSGLTDAQAVAFAARLAGGSGLLWTSGAL